MQEEPLSFTSFTQLVKGIRVRLPDSKSREFLSPYWKLKEADKPRHRQFPSFSSSKDDSRDASPPEPASPTIGLDKKTRRKFLDLG